MASASLSPIAQPDRVQAVLRAATALDASSFFNKAAGDDVSELSGETVFDGLEINPEAVFQAGRDMFEASGIVYLTLNYGRASDHVHMTDSYPAVVKGQFT